VMPAETLSNIDAIKDDLYDNIEEAWTYKGQLMGLSYFVSTRGVMHVNLEKYEELGYTDEDFPATWDELYDQLYEMREMGEEQPYLPHWISEWYGISWGFVFEVLNRGGRLADPETHEPVLDTSEGSPGWATLEDWKRIWNDGLVPEEVLTYNESAYIDAYASGRYVFSPQQLYDLETFNREDRSQIAGKASLLPYQGQSWGLLDSAVYLMTDRPRSDAHTEDVKRFANWYGYKDHEGEIFVGQRWMEESMLFSGYRSVMESDAAAERPRAGHRGGARGLRGDALPQGDLERRLVGGAQQLAPRRASGLPARGWRHRRDARIHQRQDRRAQRQVRALTPEQPGTAAAGLAAVPRAL